jgi:hypothetical protein
VGAPLVTITPQKHTIIYIFILRSYVIPMVGT